MDSVDMIDITSYINKNPDKLLEEIRSLHQIRSKLIAQTNDKIMREELESLLSELVIAIRKDSPSISRIEAEHMAKASPQYKSKLIEYQQLLAQASYANDEYWALCREFEYAMRLIDFVKQETYIMNNK